MILKGLPYFKSNGDHNLKIMFSVSVWPEINDWAHELRYKYLYSFKCKWFSPLESNQMTN